MKILMKRNQNGLTLIELMVSFGLLALVLLTSYYVLISAHQLSEESRGRLLALNAARSALEEIKDTPLTSLNTINLASYVPADLRNGNMTITTNPANVAAAQIATVTVAVTWMGPKNRQMTLQLSTMKSRFN